jgi:holo-ACP synthase/triphosphoribosyl-dephospho-CoA synthase
MNTDSSQFITGREVAVLDMLNARDRRHAIQQELIRTHNATVISFTLNIPGPIKVFPLGEMTFEEGIRLIDSQLHAWKIPVLEKRTIRDFTGNEQFWSVKGDTLFIKEILCLLEDSLSFGRLFLCFISGAAKDLTGDFICQIIFKTFIFTGCSILERKIRNIGFAAYL